MTRVQRVAARRRRRRCAVLIGFNPFNSGNEFQRTILIRVAVVSSRLLFFWQVSGEVGRTACAPRGRGLVRRVRSLTIAPGVPVKFRRVMVIRDPRVDRIGDSGCE